MSETNSKLFSIGKILGGLFFCLIVSLAVYFVSMFVAFGAWHCSSGNCRTTTNWLDIAVFSMWLSPFLIFAFGAYLCRNAVSTLTENRFLRVLMLFAFTLFPVFLIAGFIIYAVNS